MSGVQVGLGAAAARFKRVQRLLHGFQLWQSKVLLLYSGAAKLCWPERWMFATGVRRPQQEAQHARPHRHHARAVLPVSLGAASEEALIAAGSAVIPRCCIALDSGCASGNRRSPPSPSTTAYRVGMDMPQATHLIMEFWLQNFSFPCSTGTGTGAGTQLGPSTTQDMLLCCT